MKKVIILLASILILISIDGFAQLRPAQSQYLKEMGALVNPSFEQGYKGWEITGTCTQSLVSDIPYLNKTLKLTCVNQQFSVKQNTTQLTGFVNQQALLTAQVKANIGGAFIRTLNNDVEASSASIIAGDYKAINIPDKIASTSNGVEIYTNGVNVTGEFFIDEVGYRLAPDLSYQVGQAQFVGELTVQGDINCRFENSAASYSEFPDDAGCDGSYSVIGNVSAPPTSKPNIIINNARSDGYYHVEAKALYATVSDTNSCYFTLSDTTSFNNQPVMGLVTNDNQYGYEVDGDFRFSTGGDKTIRILSESGDGTSACRIFADGSTDANLRDRSLKITVHFYPESNSTIVSQKQQSPNKAGFITWSIFDGEIEGHLKADGSCVDKAVYSDYYRNVGNLYGDCDAGGGAGSGVNLPDLITSNRFIRAADGTTITVGTLQDDQFQGHWHQAIGAQSSSGLGAASGSTFNSFQNSIVRNPISDGVNGSPRFGDETRPTNIAFVPFVKMFDSDIIIGKFEQIEEVTADLTAQTANELSANLSTSGVVNNENYDFINGNCTNPATGRFVCTFNSGIFNETPSCNCTVSRTGASIANLSCHNALLNSNSVEFNVSNNGTASNLPVDIQCSKQGTDVNKSFTGAVINASQSAQTIADIVREDIISTDLCQVEAEGNDGEAITGSTEDIPFKTVIKDNCNAWSNGGNTGSNTNDQYTVQKDGRLLICIGVNLTSDFSTAIQLFSNGSLIKLISEVDNTRSFGCIQYDATEGELLTIRIGATATLSNSAVAHKITITELPDTASIVQNLATNQAIKCQKKYLSSDFTNSSGTITDLGFSNLTLGKKYIINGHVYIRVDDGGAANLNIQNNSVIYAKAELNGGAVATELANYAITTGTFTANATSVVVGANATNASRYILGNGASDETWLELCELNDFYTKTTEW